MTTTFGIIILCLCAGYGACIVRGCLAARQPKRRAR